MLTARSPGWLLLRVPWGAGEGRMGSSEGPVCREFRPHLLCSGLPLDFFCSGQAMIKALNLKCLAARQTYGGCRGFELRWSRRGAWTEAGKLEGGAIWGLGSEFNLRREVWGLIGWILLVYKLLWKSNKFYWIKCVVNRYWDWDLCSCHCVCGLSVVNSGHLILTLTLTSVAVSTIRWWQYQF